MVRYRNFQHEALNRSCRECINISYNLRLQSKDCVYYHIPGKCPICGQMKNIVMDIRFTSRGKLLFGKRQATNR